MPMTPRNRSDLEAMLNAKAWKDPKFKKKLLSDPLAALKEMGIDVPGDVQIRIVEEDQNACTLVLRKQPQNMGEMSQEELKKVAGGTGCIFNTCPNFRVSH